MIYEFLADCFAFSHIAWVLFILLGWTMVYRFPRFKYFHLGFIFVTLANMIIVYDCPLTYIEQYLRAKSKYSNTYIGPFIKHYLYRFTAIELNFNSYTQATALIFLFFLFIYIILPYIRRKLKTPR